MYLIDLYFEQYSDYNQRCGYLGLRVGDMRWAVILPFCISTIQLATAKMENLMLLSLSERGNTSTTSFQAGCSEISRWKLLLLLIDVQFNNFLLPYQYRLEVDVILIFIWFHLQLQSNRLGTIYVVFKRCSIAIERFRHGWGSSTG